MKPKSIENTCENCGEPIGVDEKYCNEECEDIYYKYSVLKRNYIGQEDV